jgi:hypothetical protein
LSKRNSTGCCWSITSTADTRGENVRAGHRTVVVFDGAKGSLRSTQAKPCSTKNRWNNLSLYTLIHSLRCHSTSSYSTRICNKRIQRLRQKCPPNDLYKFSVVGMPTLSHPDGQVYVTLKNYHTSDTIYVKAAKNQGRPAGLLLLFITIPLCEAIKTTLMLSGFSFFFRNW